MVRQNDVMNPLVPKYVQWTYRAACVKYCCSPMTNASDAAPVAVSSEASIASCHRALLSFIAIEAPKMLAYNSHFQARYSKNSCLEAAW